MKYEAVSEASLLPRSPRANAEATVLVDLVNALLTEDLFQLASRATTMSAAQLVLLLRDLPEASAFCFGEQYVTVQSRRSRRLLLFEAGRTSSGLLHMTRPPVLCLNHPDQPVPESFGPLELLEWLAEDLSEVDRAGFPGLPAFLEELSLALSHTTLALLAAPIVEDRLRRTVDPGLIEWERLAALRDRPFHPTARARRGWDNEEYRRYSPLYARPVTLKWVAVRKEWVRQSQAADDSAPASLLLKADDQALLNYVLAKDQLERTHVMLPIHPWQASRLSRLLPNAIHDQIVMPLDVAAGEFYPTASVRSLAPLSAGDDHVKLPLAIGSLGALRILPPHYLHNGVQAQAYLEALRRHDARMSQRLLLCDESRWWAYLPPGRPLTDPEAGQLGCLIRRYPMIPGDEVTMLPLSALAVQGTEGLIPALVPFIGQDQSLGPVLPFFSQLVTAVTEVAFLCLQYGAMPELHGQNLLLVKERGLRLRLLLRDHDTLRIYPPALREAGLPGPTYLLRPGPNTLITDSWEDLLSYFQTLAVQVMLASIAEAFACLCRVNERIFWCAMRDCVEQAQSSIVPSPELRRLLRIQLFEATTWPSKLILSPLFARPAYQGPGMPSGQGRTANPFREMDRGERRTGR